jgi:hypothetical protein
LVDPHSDPLVEVGRALPLTYSVEASRRALAGAPPSAAALDLAALLAFAAVLFTLSVFILARRLE